MEISQSPIVNFDSSSSTDTRMQDTSSSYNIADKAYKKTQNFSLNAGTSIIDVIDIRRHTQTGRGFILLIPIFLLRTIAWTYGSMRGIIELAIKTKP